MALSSSALFSFSFQLSDARSTRVSSRASLHPHYYALMRLFSSVVVKPIFHYASLRYAALTNRVSIRFAVTPLASQREQQMISCVVMAFISAWVFSDD